MGVKHLLRGVAAGVEKRLASWMHEERPAAEPTRPVASGLNSVAIGDAVEARAPNTSAIGGERTIVGGSSSHVFGGRDVTVESLSDCPKAYLELPGSYVLADRAGANSFEVDGEFAEGLYGDDRVGLSTVVEDVGGGNPQTIEPGEPVPVGQTPSGGTTGYLQMRPIEVYAQGVDNFFGYDVEFIAGMIEKFGDTTSYLNWFYRSGAASIHAFGSDITAAGGRVYALGNEMQLLGQLLVAVGRYNTVSGSRNVVLGENNTVLGVGNIAFGAGVDTGGWREASFYANGFLSTPGDVQTIRTTLTLMRQDAGYGQLGYTHVIGTGGERKITAMLRDDAQGNLEFRVDGIYLVALRILGSNYDQSKRLAKFVRFALDVSSGTITISNLFTETCIDVGGLDARVVTTNSDQAFQIQGLGFDGDLVRYVAHVEIQCLSRAASPYRQPWMSDRSRLWPYWADKHATLALWFRNNVGVWRSAAVQGTPVRHDDISGALTALGTDGGTVSERGLLVGSDSPAIDSLSGVVNDGSGSGHTIAVSVSWGAALPTQDETVLAITGAGNTRVELWSAASDGRLWVAVTDDAGVTTESAIGWPFTYEAELILIEIQDSFTFGRLAYEGGVTVAPSGTFTASNLDQIRLGHGGTKNRLSGHLVALWYAPQFLDRTNWIIANSYLPTKGV